jgi:hypothetical protein
MIDTNDTTTGLSPPTAVINLIVQERFRYRKAKQRQKQWTIIIASVCLVACIASLLVLVVSPSSSLILYVAFLLPLGMAPYVIRQRRQLNKVPTLVYVMNQLRQHVDTLSSSNTTFVQENQRLATEIQRLAGTEQALQTIADQNRSNVETICQLVADHRETLRSMQQLHNVRELQSLLTAILSSDLDGDHVLSERELDYLTVCLESFSALDASKIRMALSNYNNTMMSNSTTGLYQIAASTNFGDDHVRRFGTGRILQWLLEE